MRMGLLAAGVFPVLVSCIPLPGMPSFSGNLRKRDVVYVPQDWAKQLKGDLYRPALPGKLPGVLLIHGDGRVSEDGRWQMAGIAEKLADRGYVVFNITYRMAPDWEYPAPLLDAKQALNWMRDHADEYGMDGERIGAYGYSAGGYVALLTAFREDTRIGAVVGGASPVDLTYYGNGNLIRDFLGGSPGEVPERYREASPVDHVTANSPPVFLYHGEKDTLVNPDHTLEMLVELKKHRVPHEVHWIPAKGHIAAFLMPGGAVDGAIGFLDRHLK
ncbi:alpha/beta hydrolase [Akkermansiaceae bacterium]|nr:alpha/beta hydrolase [Akkermansiaceae bacterium]